MEQYSDEKLVPKIKDLNELINELHKVFDSDRVNVEYVETLMAAYKSNPKDWKQYAKFDEFRYTRNLVDEGNGKFNLIALCWGEGHGSSIHDHSNAHCFMKILHGSLQETLFTWPEQSLPTAAEGDQTATESQPTPEEHEMHEIRKAVYNKDEVAYINDSLGLHRVENLSHTDKAISLHLYSPPFNTCHTFDERTGHQRAVKITFWSKYGQRTDATADSNQCSEKANDRNVVKQ